MLNAIARFDICSYFVVAVFLYMTARQVACLFPRFAKGMAWTAVAVFLAVGVSGYSLIRMAKPMDVLAVLFIACIAASASSLAAAVLLPPLGSLWDGWKRIDEKQKEEARRREIELEKHGVELERGEQHARWVESERLRVAALPPPPTPKPPPTNDELADAARRQYESTVRMLNAMQLDDIERKSALSVAKQKLLKELGRIM